MQKDEDLYRQYLSGDETGLDSLMQRYGNSLTLYINGYLHDLHESEDLMIEVFAYVFTKKPSIRDGGLKAYMYKAARHMALRHKSRRKHSFSIDDLVEEPEEKILVEEVIRTKERNRMVMALAVAASLLLIVGLSVYMPGFTGQLSADSHSHYEMTASIFHNSNALSYIIVGLAAFILGVGVTILGVRIHHLGKIQQSAMDKGDEEDGAD